MNDGMKLYDVTVTVRVAASSPREAKYEATAIRVSADGDLLEIRGVSIAEPVPVDGPGETVEVTP